MTNGRVLVIFVKYPQPGFVKTRLAEVMGQEHAARLYRLLAEEVIARTASSSFRRVIYYTPPEKEQEMHAWLGPGLEMLAQCGSSLGERLAAAFHDTFASGASAVVTIGTDSPLLDGVTVARAFQELKRSDCVLGPCVDGGYYLVGLSGFRPELFAGIDWSTERVLGQTLDRARQAGLRHALLDRHFDVDDRNGLALLVEKLGECGAAPSARLRGLAELLKQIPRTTER